MYIGEWQDFWWNNITGPHKAVTGVAEALLSNSTVILKVPADLPWRRPMRSAIEEQIRNMSGSGNTIITQIDVADECAPDVDPGRYLLHRFAKSDVFRSYREKSGVSIQNYMIRNSVLRDTIIWIKGVDKGQASKWLKFCQGYKGASVEDGLFVLEVHEKLALVEAKNIQTVIFEECVREYDLQLFNSFVLDEQNTYNDRWKKYISTVAASLCKTDAEVSELYLRLMDLRTEDPLSGIERIAELPDFARRGEDAQSTHVLTLWRKGGKAELYRRVWEAQLQVIFPILEMHRVNIIKNLETDIQRCLQEHPVYQFGVPITDPYDLEFGTLDYLMTKQDENWMRYLYVPDEAMRVRIRFLKECRNSLAHTNCCTVDQVNELMSLSTSAMAYV